MHKYIASLWIFSILLFSVSLAHGVDRKKGPCVGSWAASPESMDLSSGWLKVRQMVGRYNRWGSAVF